MNTSIIFIIFFFALSYAAFMDYFFKRNSLDFIYYLLVLALIMLAGFRYETGHDFNSYLSYISRYSSKGSFSEIFDYFVEPSFSILSFFFGHHPLSIFIIYATIGVLLKSYVFKKLSPYPIMSLLLYFSSPYLSGDFGQIRQSAAISFFLVSVYFLLNGKLIRHFVNIALSFASHHSAIIVLSSGAFKKETISKYSFHFFKVAIPLALLFSFFSISLMQIIALTPIAKLGFLSKLAYLDNAEYTSEIGFGITDIIRLATLAVMFCMYHKVSKENKVLFLLYMFGCFIFFILKNDAIFASRLSSYFKIIDCIIIPVLIKIIRRKSFSIGFTLNIVVIVYSFLLFYKNTDIPNFYIYQINY